MESPTRHRHRDAASIHSEGFLLWVPAGVDPVRMGNLIEAPTQEVAERTKRMTQSQCWPRTETVTVCSEGPHSTAGRTGSSM